MIFERDTSLVLTLTMASLVWAMSEMTPSVMMRSTKYWEPSCTAAAYLQAHDGMEIIKLEKHILATFFQRQQPLQLVLKMTDITINELFHQICCGINPPSCRWLVICLKTYKLMGTEGNVFVPTNLLCPCEPFRAVNSSTDIWDRVHHWQEPVPMMFLEMSVISVP